MTDKQINILFVDDEPMVVTALTRMLRDMRKDWNMLTATSGTEALEKMVELPIDVDVRMPGAAQNCCKELRRSIRGPFALRFPVNPAMKRF